LSSPPKQKPRQGAGAGSALLQAGDGPLNTVILQEDDRLDFYVVTLSDEEGGAEGAYRFNCRAECESHASEQAKNAYPKAIIISIEAAA